ncbi:MAG: aspartate racemase [Osedax symbiont Rs1]|nr:MAG: aspartate racemase [Osedax symbiont Rs1]
MKTIGLLGGMSWESTVSYYQEVNRGVKRQLGGLHSAKVVMVSVDFAEIERMQHAGDWQATALILAKAAKNIELAGADFLLICTNTMHKVAEQIQANISIPIHHIADATAQVLQADKITKVGLLGTKFTMQQDFYRSRLEDKFAIQVVVPLEDQQQRVHEIIYTELVLGEIKETSRAEYLAVIDSLFARGAEAVILGCTEIALLVEQQHTDVPLYDTTAIHAQSAVVIALAN